MQQVISSSNIHSFKDTFVTRDLHRTAMLSSFVAWCNGQESNRLFWLGIALMGCIGTVLPLTLRAIVFFAANNFVLWVIAIVINVLMFTVSLAAQPQKVTLPFLFFALVANALIIGYCFVLIIGQ